MFRDNLWLLILIVAAFWTALVANSSPAVLKILRTWSGAILIGALVGSMAGYAAASVSPEWQWHVGLAVGVFAGLATVVFRRTTKKGINGTLTGNAWL